MAGDQIESKEADICARMAEEAVGECVEEEDEGR